SPPTQPTRQHSLLFLLSSCLSSKGLLFREAFFFQVLPILFDIFFQYFLRKIRTNRIIFLHRIISIRKSISALFFLRLLLISSVHPSCSQRFTNAPLIAPACLLGIIDDSFFFFIRSCVGYFFVVFYNENKVRSFFFPFTQTLFQLFISFCRHSQVLGRFIVFD